ncbi:hypothetical protein D3C76_1531370 [compost metagenome]
MPLHRHPVTLFKAELQGIYFRQPLLNRTQQARLIQRAIQLNIVGNRIGVGMRRNLIGNPDPGLRGDQRQFSGERPFGR